MSQTSSQPPASTPAWVKAIGGLGIFIVILFLCACVTIAILTLLGPEIGNVFSRITYGLSTAP